MALNLINSTTPTGTIDAADVAADMQAIESWASARETEIGDLEAKVFGYALQLRVNDEDSRAFAVVPFNGTVKRAYFFLEDVGAATGDIILQDGGTDGTGTTAIHTFTTVTTGTGNETQGINSLNHTVTAGDVLAVDASDLDNAALGTSGDWLEVTVWIETSALI